MAKKYPHISFSAGPSHLSEKTLQLMKDIIDSGFLSVSHRSPEFSEVSKSAIEGLRKQLKIPADYRIFYQPSSTAGMDTLLQNLVNDNSFHFVQGDFSERFFKTADALRIKAIGHQVPWEKPIDWQNAPIPKGTELIGITHNETRTGLMWPLEEIKKVKEAYPDSLIAVDVTSSLGGVILDWENADIWFGAVQKCLGMPPGLGYLIVNQRALEKSRSIKRTIPDWHRFVIMDQQMNKYQVFETPNLLQIALLAKLMEDWNMDAIDKETKRKAKFIYGSDLDWEPYIKDPKWQSTVCVHFKVDDAQKWHKKARENNFILGSSFGRYKDTGVRVSNFPSHTYEIISALFAALRK